jgi:hypothetical protein
MFTQDLLEQNKVLVNNFLVIRKIAPEFKIPIYEDRFGYIYCIENKLDNKKYIGSTYSNWMDVKDPNISNPLRKRASQYLYEYNKGIKNTISIKKLNRPIIQAMIDNGFENFIMYPLAETTKKNHTEAEKYFINYYNTIENGYNVIYGRGLTHHIGRALSTKDKKLRSEPIISINFNNKQIIFSDSMKLFADYMNSSKDMIKNVVRLGDFYKGWISFYIDTSKRKYILEKVLEKSGYHSTKRKEFYTELVNNIEKYIKDSKSELFYNFEILEPLKY